MSNPYTQYYANQVGSGIPGFSGVRYQRGSGFFSKIFQSAILPALKYLGRTALSAGSGILSDVAEGQNIKESIKTRGLAAGKKTAMAAMERGQRFLQTGQGRRRKRRTKSVRSRKRKILIKPAKVNKRRRVRRRRKTKKSIPAYLQ